MSKNYLPFLLLLTLGFFFSGCEQDDPVIPNEEELITTLGYTLTPVNGTDVVTLLFQDFDGDGGDAPIITGGMLAANETYTGSLQLLNESETPTEDITAEVEEEDLEHQFFFQSDIAGLNVIYGDQDSEGNPLGLRSTLITGDAASGTLTVTLRHEPNKSASGVSDGLLENAGGETDIEVTFPIDVQ